MIAASLLFVVLFGADAGKRDFVRSFFGVHKIQEADDGQFRILKHGTIEHGAQRIRDADGKPLTGRPQPITYYHDQSPMVEGLNAVARQARRRSDQCRGGRPRHRHARLPDQAGRNR